MGWSDETRAHHAHIIIAPSVPQSSPWRSHRRRDHASLNAGRIRPGDGQLRAEGLWDNEMPAPISPTIHMVHVHKSANEEDDI